ncbi:hypothetical protein GY45DRAFT_1374000 [Cubamyces sp. BRFM 1775]|nr:hypothetical protein GY45DRAFT_1374000 [Cubamyces sp. BRFM 1775]
MPTQTRSHSLGLSAYDASLDVHSVDDLHSVWGHHKHNHNHHNHHQHRLHAEADEEPAVSSSSSFSSAVRRNETTPAKRRHAGSDATPRRSRNDHDPWAGDEDRETASHSHARARTLDGDVGRGTSTSHHPLKPRSGSGSGSSSSEGGLVHNTRPTMRRLLSLDEDTGDARERSHEREREGETRRGKEREMLVIVHEVQPTDSLAGVALKYGISLADLRRANQLWPSDPIHLRDTLYIPIDKARHMKHLVLDALQNGDSASRPDCSDAADRPDASTSQTQRQPEQTGKYTLRRVPASQLSFFPPPTQSSPPRVHANGGQPPSFNTQSRTMPSRKPTSRRPALPVSFSRSQDAGGASAPAPLQNVLDLFSTSLHATAHQLRTYAQSQSALFAAAAAFPAKPATSSVGAAAAVARLSIDSNSATASSASEEVDWEHEMEDIGALGSGSGSGRRQSQRGHGQMRRSRSYSTSRARQGGVVDGATLRARKPRETDPDERESVELDSVPFGSANGASSSSTLFEHESGRRRRGSSSSQSHSQSRAGAHARARWASEGSGAGANGHAKRAVPYVADAVDNLEGSVVRTAQLEPSPGMQLPSLQRRRPSVREGES